MFRDKEEELQRLSEELRAQERADEESDGEDMLDILLDDDMQIGAMKDSVYKNASNEYGSNLRNYASGYRAYNADKTEVDPTELSDALLDEDEPSEKSLTGLVITAFALAAAVVGVLIWMLIRGGFLS